MSFLKVFVFCSIFLAASLDAAEQTGILSFSNPAKGFYVFGFKGLKNPDKVCASKYLIPEKKTALINLVKILDERTIKIAYAHRKIDGGGTRDHCVVSDITVIKGLSK